MKKLCLFLLVTVAALVLCGCVQENTGGWQIWSTYNTTKVIQLIITADRDITYMLTAGILKNESGDIFPAESIRIYHQKYQTIPLNYNGDKAFQPGDSIPDMLLPLHCRLQPGGSIRRCVYPQRL